MLYPQVTKSREFLILIVLESTMYLRLLSFPKGLGAFYHLNPKLFLSKGNAERDKMEQRLTEWPTSDQPNLVSISQVVTNP